MKLEVKEPDLGSVKLPKNWRMSALTVTTERVDTSWRAKRKPRIQSVLTSKREKQAFKLSKDWIKTNKDSQLLNGQGDKFFAKIPGKKRSQFALSSKAAKSIIKLPKDWIETSLNMLNRPNTAPSNNLSRVTNDNFTSISKPVSVVKKLPKNWFETVRDMKTVKVNGSVDRYKDEMGRYKHSVSSRKQEQNTKKLPKNWIETAVTNVAQNRPEMKLNVGSKEQTEANSSSKLNPEKIKLPNNWFNDIPETGHEKKAVTVAPVKLAKGWDLAASALVKDSLSRKDCTSIHISKGPRRKLGRCSSSSKNVNNVAKLPKNWMMTALARMPRTTQDNEPIITSRKESRRHGHHGKVSKISPPIVKLPKDWVKTALPGEMKGNVKTLVTRPEQLGEDWQVRNPHSWKKSLTKT